MYRVPRLRTVTSQAADPGSPTPSNPWFQPDDVTDETQGFSSYLVSQFGTGGPGVDLMDWFASGSSPIADTSVFNGDQWRWETIIIALTRGDLSGATLMSSYDPGTLPPGATGFEAEDANGVVTRAKMDGRLFTGDSTVDTTGVYQIRTLTPSTLNPGHLGAYTSRIGPDRAWSGGIVHTHSGTASPQVFDTGYQDWDEADERLGWQVAELHAFDESTFVGTDPFGYGTYGINLNGPVAFGGSVRITFDWRPSRIRWTF